MEKEKQLTTDKDLAVQLHSNDNYTTQVVTGKHQFLADEPESAGGNDKGPAPYDFLMAGLGSCTAMTLHMYARHKKWDLKNVIVHLSHKKIKKQDPENENMTIAIDKFERIIEIEGDLDEKQRKRLLQIADKCPVHKTFEHGIIQVSSELKEE